MSIVLVIVLLLFSGDAHAQNRSVHLVGSGAKATCGRWLANRASQDYFSMGNWALGFLSGVAVYTDDLDPLDEWTLTQYSTG
jgi:hypothetical protein